ncbi:MAG: PspC domain-containing protein [Thermodesulfobacteriota bacterium]
MGARTASPALRSGGVGRLFRCRRPDKKRRRNMPAQNWLQRLSRAEDDRWLGGVCGGLGKHTPLPSWVWRVIFSLLFFCVGTGLLLYILLWIFIPKEH